MAVPLVWIVVLLVAPLAAMVAWSVAIRGRRRATSSGPSPWRTSRGWRASTHSAGRGRTSPSSAARSLMSAVTTVITIALAYPLAFFIARRPPTRRYLWLALIIIPFCTNLVIRTYAWMLLLGNQMPPARIAQWLRLIEPSAALYPSTLAAVHRHGLQLAALRRAAAVHERGEAGLGDRGGQPRPVRRSRARLPPRHPPPDPARAW